MKLNSILNFVRGMKMSRHRSKVVGTRFAREMKKVLRQYTDDIVDKVADSVPTIAEETVDDISSKASELFNGTGEYAISWTTDKVNPTRYSTATIIHSVAPFYRLTHLLEKGHAKAGGGRVKGRKHIKPAEENAVKKLEEKIKEVINNAN